MPEPEPQAPPEKAPPGGGPPPDPFFVNPIYYLEDNDGNPLDWSQFPASSNEGVISRFVLSKNENGEAVFTCRMEEFPSPPPPAPAS